MKSSRWMKLVVLVLSLLVAVPALSFAQSGGGTGGSGSGGSGGGSVNGRGGSATFRSNNPMPVLIYTVWGLGNGSSGSSGSGGSGVTSSSNVSTLVIYDNGLATWSQSNADGTNTSGCSGNCLDTIQISASQVNQLVTQLRQAGAFRQSSNNGSATSSDTSLSTITVFRYVQGSTSVAQTFSFNSSQAQGRLGGIQNVFSNFFSSNFGSSSINGNGSGSGGGS